MARRSRISQEIFPSNNRTISNTSEPIVRQGSVRTGQRGPHIANTVRNVGNDLFRDIVMPTIKNMLAEFFSDGISRLIFGSGDTPSGYGYGGGHRSYNRPYRTPSRSSRRRSTVSRHREPNYRAPQSPTEVMDDIFFDNRQDAKNVLGRLMELIADRNYNIATVGDLYSIIGLSTNYTQERYGWDDLAGVKVLHTTQGYVIDFPEPIYLL